MAGDVNITSPAAAKAGRLYLRGPLQLRSAEGRTCTPAGGIRKALLALLVLSDTGSRGRSRLQSLLWEACPPAQAAANLRTALSVLRKELRSGLGFDPITADAQTVSIDRSRLWVDVLDDDAAGEAAFGVGPGTDLLEGLDLRTAGGEDFEDWLRAERSRLDARRLEGSIGGGAGARRTARAREPTRGERRVGPDAGAVLATAANPLFAGSAGPTTIGLLPVLVNGRSPMATLLAEAVQDAIADDLHMLGDVVVHDYRRAGTAHAPEHDLCGPQLLLSVVATCHEERCILQLRTYQHDARTLLASDTITCGFGNGLVLEDAATVAFVARNVDRLLDWYAPSDGASARAAATPFHLIESMFRLDVSEFDRLDHKLAALDAAADSPVYAALRAYLQTFRIGERWGRYERGIDACSREMISRLLGSNTDNGIALFATGHVLGYTLHEHALAEDYLASAVRRCPSLAICWDHLALNHLYRGDYESARHSVERALSLAAFSPLRFTYETTACMVATLEGDYRHAVEMGQRALARKPDFGAALRYLTISLAHLGQHEQAAVHGARLLAIDPDFSSDWIEEGRFALTDNDARRRLRSGLRLVGIR